MGQGGQRFPSQSSLSGHFPSFFKCCFMNHTVVLTLGVIKSVLLDSFNQPFD